MRQAQNAANFHGWVLSVNQEVDENTEIQTVKNIDQVQEPPLITYKPSDINLDKGNYFDGLVDREDQINALLSAVNAYTSSGFSIRPHTLLWGEPASGKTTLMERLVNMVGEDAVYKIDATTSTQSGLITDLFERSIRPNFILIEEAEKVKDKEHLNFLLGVMDQRAEVRICNSRIGNLHMHLPALVIANVNDINKFDSFASRALSSRFSNRIYCPNISQDIMRQAIYNDVAAIHPKMEWVYKAIEYCSKYEKNADIRRISTIVACGQDNLLNGSYQSILRRTTR